MRLLQAGLDPDYFAIRDADTLRTVTPRHRGDRHPGRCPPGTTRLIDNVRIALNPVSDGACSPAHTTPRPAGSPAAAVPAPT